MNYPIHFKKKILAKLEKDQSIQDVAQQFEVNKNTVVEWKNQTKAIYQNKLFTVSLFDRKVNSDVFHLWVDKFLIPKLPAHSVIVMDNAPFHKRQNMQNLLTRHGHQIL